MNPLLRIGATFAVALACTSVRADVSNDNPYCKIAIVGADTVHFAGPAETLDDAFQVRLTNPEGQPLNGLKVEFFVNQTFSMPGQPPDPTPPQTYGHFDTSSVLATTDAQGIARSGRFTAGTVAGSYEVVAAVYVTFHEENLAACQVVPGPRASFQIIQGSSAPMSDTRALPSLSGTSLAALATLFLLMAVYHRRRLAQSQD